MNSLLTDRFLKKKELVEEWLSTHENPRPVYLSADIRDAGFKISSVDANLFPAGFNNLTTNARLLASQFFAQMKNEHPDIGNRILLILEEHTRNLWYLENAAVLQKILLDAGYEVTLTTALPVQGVEYHDGMLDLFSQSGLQVSLLDPGILPLELGESFDVILLNNDLSQTPPEYLQKSNIPVLPAWEAGWFNRKKSGHFRHYKELAVELAQVVGIDPWFLFPLDYTINQVDINNDEDRLFIADTADKLLLQIQARYDEYNIDQKPFLFLKSNSGTYGMGLLPIESGNDIRNLNRKDRNKLFRGKGGNTIDSYILQEGIASVIHEQGFPAEPVIYLIDGKAVAGFYRVNREKTERQNLNSNGMFFSPFELHAIGVNNHPVNPQHYLYTVIARLASVAAQREICELTRPNEPCFSHG